MVMKGVSCCHRQKVLVDTYIKNVIKEVYVFTNLEGFMVYTYEQMLAGAENVFAIAGEMGLSINQNSRFHRVLNKYKNIKNLSIDERKEETFVEGINDLYQLIRIFECKELIHTDFGKKELSKIWGGTESMFCDKKTTPRDIQYQLYIMSIFKKYFQVKAEEPDFSVIYLSKEHSVAVKRINTEANILRRIKNAEKQIQKTNKNGIIVIGMDRILCDTNNSHPYEVLKNYINQEIYTQDLIEDLKQSTKSIVFTFGKHIFNDKNQNYGYTSGIYFISVYDVGNNDDRVNYGERLCQIFENENT